MKEFMVCVPAKYCHVYFVHAKTKKEALTKIKAGPSEDVETGCLGSCQKECFSVAQIRELKQKS